MLEDDASAKPFQVKERAVAVIQFTMLKSARSKSKKGEKWLVPFF
jgi:hypothetical protein